jgi:hypothetical protein
MVGETRKVQGDLNGAAKFEPHEIADFDDPTRVVSVKPRIAFKNDSILVRNLR